MGKKKIASLTEAVMSAPLRHGITTLDSHELADLTSAIDLVILGKRHASAQFLAESIRDMYGKSVSSTAIRNLMRQRKKVLHAQEIKPG